MKTCLVVDDSRVIRKVARRILEDMKFEVLEAADGAEALAACESAMPEAVLLDWNMGGDAPIVVFCTTENDINHITEALSSGANEYIMQPFDGEILEAKFQEVGLI